MGMGTAPQSITKTKPAVIGALSPAWSLFLATAFCTALGLYSNGEPRTIRQTRSVQCFDRHLCAIVLHHVHETYAFGNTCITVNHYSDSLDRAEGGENLVQVAISGVVW